MRKPASHRRSQRQQRYRADQQDFLAQRHARWPRYRQIVQTAIHEAGHVVALLELGWPFKEVTIRPTATMRGQCELDPAALVGVERWYRLHPDADLLRDVARIVGAGYHATALVTGHNDPQGTQHDLQVMIVWLCVWMPDRLSPTAHDLRQEARQLVSAEQHWLAAMPYRLEAVQTIASALLLHRTLSREQVMRLVRTQIPLPALRWAPPPVARPVRLWRIMAALVAAATLVDGMIWVVLSVWSHHR